MITLISELITSVVCSTVAALTTIYRLYIRGGRLWWDDAFAAFSMLVLLVQVASVALHVHDPTRLTQLQKVAGYYLLPMTFYAVLWSARLSIVFSIIRIDPWEARQKRLLVVAVLFFITFVVLMIQPFWVCEPDPSWKQATNPQCDLGLQVAVCQLVTDVIADSILLAAPLRILRGLEDKSLRRRLVLIFSACIVTTVVSLVHAAYILTRGGPKVIVSGIVEVAVSLIVCNLPVVVTYTMRLTTDQPESSASDSFSSSFLKFASMRTSRAQRTTFGGTKVTSLALNRLGVSSMVQTHQSTSSLGLDEGDTMESAKSHQVHESSYGEPRKARHVEADTSNV